MEGLGHGTHGLTGDYAECMKTSYLEDHTKAIRGAARLARALGKWARRSRFNQSALV